MDSSNTKISFINQLIFNNELDYQEKCNLLILVKDIQFGVINYSNGLKSIQLCNFYDNYANDISLWLSEPEETVYLKIKENNFTELENKLILTNILIKFGKEKANERLS